MDSDTIAIIVGCAAGGVVLVIVLAVTLYFFCGRKKHRKKRQHSKFRHMTPPVSPMHSQPSSLGHNPEARLPKVNSTGLWMGAPSMYAGGPAPAYYIGRGIPVSTKVPVDPRFIARASSETRIPQSGYPHVQPRPFYGSQSNLVFIPSQSGQRIYHSQQLTPLYEVPARNGGMEIYDVYQFGGFSKSKLAESKHTKSYYDDGFMLRSKLERSKSDVGEMTKHAQRSSEKSRQSSHHSRSSSHEGKRHRSSSRETNNRPTSEYGNSSRGSKSANSFKEASQRSSVSGQNNRAFSADADLGRNSAIREEVSVKPSMVSASMKPPKPQVATSSVATVAGVTYSPPLVNGTLGLVSAIVKDHDDINQSATDSMKLLAKNKTDDQKTIVPQKAHMSESVEGNEFESKNIGHQHYIYHGDIYAISGNRKFIDEEEENPIISRMKDMVIEKSRNSNQSSPLETQRTPNIYNEIGNSSSDILKNNHDPIYEEIKIEKREIITKEITVTEDLINEEDLESDRSRGTKLPNLANLSIMDGFELPPTPDSGHYEFVEKTVSNDIGVSNNERPLPDESSQLASPIALREKGTSLKGTDDVDGATEEISTAGKRITDSAFEFLNTYLSDEEGADGQIDSPPLSPSS